MKTDVLPPEAKDSEDKGTAEEGAPTNDRVATKDYVLYICTYKQII